VDAFVEAVGVVGVVAGVGGGWAWWAHVFVGHEDEAFAGLGDAVLFGVEVVLGDFVPEAGEFDGDSGEDGFCAGDLFGGDPCGVRGGCPVGDGEGVAGAWVVAACAFACCAVGLAGG
jgi:hypothetical protein